MGLGISRKESGFQNAIKKTPQKICSPLNDVPQQLPQKVPAGKPEPGATSFYISWLARGVQRTAIKRQLKGLRMRSLSVVVRDRSKRLGIFRRFRVDSIVPVICGKSIP